MAKTKRTWILANEFYQHGQVTSRYGGEVDFGMFWTTDAEHHKGRLTWIPLSGEWYIAATKNNGENQLGRYVDIMVLGMTEPKNREQAERVMSGWATACLDGKGIDWIVKRLGIYTQEYMTLELAARAYGREVGINGTGGGWLYQWDATKPICQGWGALGDLLVRQGHIRQAPERFGTWRIVDSRAMIARQRDGLRERAA
jgi:hypothetical protein